MRATVAAAVLLLASQATAAPLPEVPPPKSTQSNITYKNLLRWRDTLNDPMACLPREYQMNEKITRLQNEVVKVADPADRAAYIDYFNKQIVPTFNAMVVGVPGYGTWAEIAAKRDASRKWLADNLPKGPAKTKEEVTAFVAAYKAYKARAAEDHAWVDGLMQVSGCHRVSTGANTELTGFDSWRHQVSPGNVDMTLKGIRNPLIPGLGMMEELDKYLGEGPAPETTPGTDAAKTKAKDKAAVAAGGDGTFSGTGGWILDAVGLYDRIEKAKASFDVLPLWAELFEGAEKEELSRFPAVLAEKQAKLAERAAAALTAVELPKQTGDKKLEKNAKKAGFAARYIITSKLEKFDREETKTEDLGDKIRITKFRVKGEGFTVVALAKRPPRDWWPDLPGVPKDKVCTAYNGEVHKYTKGIGYKLNTWQYAGDAPTSPFLCSKMPK